MNHKDWGAPREPHEVRDDEPGVMGMDERSAWVQIFVFAITTSAYLFVVFSRLRDTPVEDVEWVAPLLWAIGISIVTVIVGSIISGIGGAMGLAMRGRDPDVELKSDSRDKDIARHARLRTYWVGSVLGAGTLVLAMLDVDTLWIGTYVFAVSSAGAINDAAVRIRAYRRGFVS